MLMAERDLGEVRERLAAWLRTRMPEAKALAVDHLKTPGAGLSNETILFDLAYDRAGARRSERLVLRAQPSAFQVFPDYDLTIQSRILRALEGTAVPVPRVRFECEDPEVLGTPFYVMERVEGVVPSDVPPYHALGMVKDAAPAERAALWWAGIETLAAIHGVDPKARGLGFLARPAFGADPLEQQLGYYAHYLDWAREGTEQPTTAAALRWLRANRPVVEDPRLCWGDARLPNLIYRDGRVAAVLDWEMAFLGDPAADLGWWLFLDWHHSEGYGIPRLGGLPTRAETVARWEGLTGRSARHLDYYEVFAAFRFAVIMVRVARHMKAAGTPMPHEDFERVNACTRRLAELLELPMPGGESFGGATGDAPVVIQFRLTGDGAYDWYAVIERGMGVRHEGVYAGEPDVTMTTDRALWEALGRGEADRSQAFLTGKLRIEGDIQMMARHEAMIQALSDGGPGATHQDTDGVAGVLTGTVPEIGDDRRHRPGPDSLPLWNESLWFPMYDPARDLGVVLRAGAHPNKGEANLYLFIAHRGEIVHTHVDTRASEAPFAPERLEMANGLTIEWTKPLEEFRLRYASDRSGFDLTWRASSPPYLYPPPPGTSSDQVPRHIEGAGTVHGTVTIGGVSQPFEGVGHRDHSFGGERDWDKFYRWNYLSGEFDDFWFNAVRIRFGPDFPEVHIGCVWNGREHHGLAKIEMDVATADGGARQTGVDLRITDASGAAHHIVGDKIFANGCVRIQRTWIKDAFIRYRMGGRVGYGILEHGYREDD